MRSEIGIGRSSPLSISNALLRTAIDSTPNPAVNSHWESSNSGTGSVRDDRDIFPRMVQYVS